MEMLYRRVFYPISVIQSLHKCKRQVGENLNNAFIRQRLIILDPTEKGVASNILVLLCSQFVNGKYTPAQRELIIGCASTSSGPKKVRKNIYQNHSNSTFFFRMVITHSII